MLLMSTKSALVLEVVSSHQYLMSSECSCVRSLFAYWSTKGNLLLGGATSCVGFWTLGVDAWFAVSDTSGRVTVWGPLLCL